MADSNGENLYEFECERYDADGGLIDTTKTPMKYDWVKSPEHAIGVAESLEVGRALYPNMSNQELGSHRVDFKLLLNGVLIAEGTNDRYNFGMEFPNY